MTAFRFHLDRLADLHARWADLDREREQAEHKFLADIKACQADGSLTVDQLADLYTESRPNVTPSFPARWRAVLPVNLNGVASKAAHRAKRRARAVECATPNGPGGHYWTGTAPLPPSEPIPLFGVPVVYVLYDATHQPIYVGSTDRFRIRLAQHLRAGKPVAYWTAYRCPDRAAAYELEHKLLREYKLPLNRRASR